jgi:hypothetical protein
MKVVLFGFIFTCACLAALAWPAAGVYAYMANYLVGPENFWWGDALRAQGARFSFFLAAALAGGLVFGWSRLREFNRSPLLHSQEWLVIAFVAVVLLTRLWGVPIDNGLRDLSGMSETPAEKMVKVAIFALMMTHILVRYREANRALWLLVLVGGLYLGLDGYLAPEDRYVNGRLDRLGGTDFRESSTVAAHLVFVSALTGALFLKSRQWWRKLGLVVAGAFSVNALILTQTRAAMLALAAGGVIAPFLAMRGRRLRVSAYVLLGALGALALINKEFWLRAETLTVGVEELDQSAASRLDVWEAGLQMFYDHPLGVGAGSFYTAVGSYNPAYAGRDCHNTYIRCLAELGVPGILVFLALIVNAFRTLRRIPALAAGTPVEESLQWDCFGLQVALVAYLTAGFFMGLTYVEEFWWFICMPVCLERAARNARQEETTSSSAVKLPTRFA